MTDSCVSEKRRHGRERAPALRLKLLSSGILGAQQAVGLLVLLDGGETAHGGIEAVVVGVVVALADLAQQAVAGTGLNLEVMVQVLGDGDGLARGQADLGTGGNGVGPAVGVDGDIGLVVDGLIGQGVVDPDQDIAAAAVDDVLGLEPVEVVGGILALLQEQQLLSVDLGSADRRRNR